MATIKNRPIARDFWTYGSGLAIYDEDSSNERLLVGYFGAGNPNAKWLPIIVGPDGGFYIRWKNDVVPLDDFTRC